jgi:hypothetical protein
MTQISPISSLNSSPDVLVPTAGRQSAALHPGAIVDATVIEASTPTEARIRIGSEFMTATTQTALSRDDRLTLRVEASGDEVVLRLIERHRADTARTRTSPPPPPDVARTLSMVQSVLRSLAGADAGPEVTEAARRVAELIVSAGPESAPTLEAVRTALLAMNQPPEAALARLIARQATMGERPIPPEARMVLQALAELAAGRATVAGTLSGAAAAASTNAPAGSPGLPPSLSGLPPDLGLPPVMLESLERAAGTTATAVLAALRGAAPLPSPDVWGALLARLGGLRETATPPATATQTLAGAALFAASHRVDPLDRSDPPSSARLLAQAFPESLVTRILTAPETSPGLIARVLLGAPRLTILSWLAAQSASANAPDVRGAFDERVATLVRTLLGSPPSSSTTSERADLFVALSALAQSRAAPPTPLARLLGIVNEPFPRANDATLLRQADQLRGAWQALATGAGPVTQSVARRFLSALARADVAAAAVADDAPAPPTPWMATLVESRVAAAPWGLALSSPTGWAQLLFGLIVRAGLLPPGAALMTSFLPGAAANGLPTFASLGGDPALMPPSVARELAAVLGSVLGAQAGRPSAMGTGPGGRTRTRPGTSPPRPGADGAAVRVTQRADRRVPSTQRPRLRGQPAGLAAAAVRDGPADLRGARRLRG